MALYLRDGLLDFREKSREKPFLIRAMTGYQEILTDPSYKGQIVTMTYPLIGNYGMNQEDVESQGPKVEGFVVKESSSVFSNWRGDTSLSDYLVNHGIMGVEAMDTAKKLVDLGFEIAATKGTAKVLSNNGIPVHPVFKVGEGRPDIVDQIKNGEIHLVINTPGGKKPKADEVAIRSQSVAHNIPCVTTLSGAEAVVNAIESLKRGMSVKSVQEYHREIAAPSPRKPVVVSPTIP